MEGPPLNKRTYSEITSNIDSFWPSAYLHECLSAVQDRMDSDPNLRCFPLCSFLRETMWSPSLFFLKQSHSSWERNKILTPETLWNFVHPKNIGCEILISLLPQLFGLFQPYPFTHSSSGRESLLPYFTFCLFLEFWA